jgi:hypothetical protein
LILQHGQKLFSLCEFDVLPENANRIFNRKFLGRLTLEASWMEETLDSYGSQFNLRWSQFRKTVAAVKMFSSVCYTMLHIQKTAPYYNLQPNPGDFPHELERTIDRLIKALILIAREILRVPSSVEGGGLPSPIKSDEDEDEFEDILLKGKLDSNLNMRQIPETYKTLVYLATNFLNQSGDLEPVIETGDGTNRRDYHKYIPDQISEDKLRLVKAQFHILQSYYDTYLSQTDLEHRNPTILSLRGHVSIVFHLLEAASNFSHYYERHIVAAKNHEAGEPFLPLSTEHHLSLLFDFFLTFAKLYFSAAKNLCRQIISEYSETSEITVSIPPYRGFHVRPSTLIAKIVIHYGSHVTMIMDDEEYDASSPMELFRANEKINSAKRRFVNQLASSETLVDNLKNRNQQLWPEQVQLLILKLMDKNIVNLYEQNLSLEGINPEEGESPLEYFQKVIARFLASGKIDIQQDLFVVFKGDKRVLMDLKLLAEAGYGEDRNGNNIMLPSQLSYLKRSC